MSDNFAIVSVENQDIYGLQLAKQNSKYANNISHDLLRLAIERAKLEQLKDCFILALEKKMLVNKFLPKLDGGTFVSEDYKFSQDIIDIIYLFDQEEYDKINPFQIKIDFETRGVELWKK